MLIRPYFHRRAWLNVDDDLLRLGIISTGTHGLLRDPRATTAAANKPTIVAPPANNASTLKPAARCRPSRRHLWLQCCR